MDVGIFSPEFSDTGVLRCAASVICGGNFRYLLTKCIKGSKTRIHFTGRRGEEFGQKNSIAQNILSKPFGNFIIAFMWTY
jgi:hypothetical protein